MHEISLINSVINTLNDQYQEKVPKIIKIKLKIGELSNLHPILIKNAFEAVTSTNHPNYKDKILEIEFLKTIIECPECKSHTEIENYKFICNHCGLATNNIIQGTEILISGVEIKD